MSKKNDATRRKSNKLPVPRRGGAVVQFDPKKAFDLNAKGEVLMEYAKKVRDWEALDAAVEKHIENQSQLVAWWNEVVRRAGNPIGADQGQLPRAEAEKLSGFKHQKISKFGRLLEDIPAYTARLRGPSYKVGLDEKKGDSQLVQQSTSAEHYTPPQYIEAARQVLGSIDLDPASCKAANKVVKATEFFDKKHDGLSRDWNCKVWLNPPYGDLVGKFIAKLMAELDAGRTTEAIVLVNAHCTDTAWFQPLWEADACCFTNHRINFTGDEARSGSTHGSVFVYFGPNKALFEEHFLQFGPIILETVTKVGNGFLVHNKWSADVPGSDWYKQVAALNRQADKLQPMFRWAA